MRAIKVLPPGDCEIGTDLADDAPNETRPLHILLGVFDWQLEVRLAHDAPDALDAPARRLFPA
jgi:hypothetical protein